MHERERGVVHSRSGGHIRPVLSGKRGVFWRQGKRVPHMTRRIGARTGVRKDPTKAQQKGRPKEKGRHMDSATIVERGGALAELLPVEGSDFGSSEEGQRMGNTGLPHGQRTGRGRTGERRLVTR